MDEERRGIKRFPLELPALITCADADLDQVSPRYTYCYTRDVSSSGAFFPCTQPYPPKSEVSVFMIIAPKNKPVKCTGPAVVQMHGTVVRKETNGMAVSFAKSSRVAPVLPEMGNMASCLSR